MNTVSAEVVKDKKVILRYDIDVPLRQAQGKLVVADDFRLKAGLKTANLCLEQASKVTLIGHIGRPDGKVVPDLSVNAIKQWFLSWGINSPKLVILENLRFDPRESFDTAQDETAVSEFARELAQLGDIFINESFAAYRPAASTTLLPKLLPSYAGLNFTSEVNLLSRVRNNPTKPFIAILGGAKVADKLPIMLSLSKIADAVLVGGKLPIEMKEKGITVPGNVMVGKLNEDSTDLAVETVSSWRNLIAGAKMIVWNGPLGLVDEGKLQTKTIAEMIIDSGVESIVGGGDTIAALDRWGLLDKFRFISTGGGAMLKLLETGTLPTIEALSYT